MNFRDFREIFVGEPSSHCTVRQLFGQFEHHFKDKHTEFYAVDDLSEALIVNHGIFLFEITLTVSLINFKDLMFTEPTIYNVVKKILILNYLQCKPLSWSLVYDNFKVQNASFFVLIGICRKILCCAYFSSKYMPTLSAHDRYDGICQEVKLQNNPSHSWNSYQVYCNSETL